MKKRVFEYTLVTSDSEYLDLFLEYSHNKKYLKKIMKKNDKVEPFYCIILLSIDTYKLKKILKNKFKNKILIR